MSRPYPTGQTVQTSSTITWSAGQEVAVVAEFRTAPLKVMVARFLAELTENVMVAASDFILEYITHCNHH